MLSLAGYAENPGSARAAFAEIDLHALPALPLLQELMLSDAQVCSVPAVTVWGVVAVLAQAPSASKTGDWQRSTARSAEAMADWCTVAENHSYATLVHGVPLTPGLGTGPRWE